MGKSAGIQVELSKESLKAIHDIVADVVQAVALTPKSVTVSQPELDTATAYLFGSRFEEYGFAPDTPYPVYRQQFTNLGQWFVESEHGPFAGGLPGKRGFWMEDANDPRRDPRTGLRLQRWGGVIA